MARVATAVAGDRTPPAGRRSSGDARERLLRAALSKIDADGALAARLEDIRAQAGVSVGALYHHFPDKAALADALHLELTEAFQADSSPSCARTRGPRRA